MCSDLEEGRSCRAIAHGSKFVPFRRPSSGPKVGASFVRGAQPNTTIEQLNTKAHSP